MLFSFWGFYGLSDFQKRNLNLSLPARYKKRPYDRDASKYIGF